VPEVVFEIDNEIESWTVTLPLQWAKEVAAGLLDISDSGEHPEWPKDEAVPR
jgi:hypothetical protein